jgi:hypothetical protein
LDVPFATTMPAAWVFSEPQRGQLKVVDIPTL